MDEHIQLNWSAVERLVPLCLEFRRQCKNGEEIDVGSAVMQAARALGIEDLDDFMTKKVKVGLQTGFNQALGDSASEELATLFASFYQPVMTLVYNHAKNGGTAEQFMAELNKTWLNGSSELQVLLLKTFKLPDEAARVLAQQLGLRSASLYCFAATYKIYQRAAHDAELAKERRIELERMANEAALELKNQRSEIEQLVNAYLLDRLLPFSESLAAMDQAVLDDDDERFIAANTELWSLFGRDAQYRTRSEFDSLMLSNETFRL